MSLPGLATLRAFDAASRHLSFTRAAAELGVQPPAISRQVAELETSLGAALFVRSKPRLTLTDAGRRLATVVADGFAGIATVAESIRSGAGQDLLRVNVSIGIASCWLMARLGEFRARHPDIELQLVTRDSNRDFAADDAHVVVLLDQGALPGARVEKLFAEELIAVCGTNFAAGADTLTPGQIASLPLLRPVQPRVFARLVTLVRSRRAAGSCA